MNIWNYARCVHSVRPQILFRIEYIRFLEISSNWLRLLWIWIKVIKPWNDNVSFLYNKLWTFLLLKCKVGWVGRNASFGWDAKLITMVGQLSWARVVKLALKLHGMAVLLFRNWYFLPLHTTYVMLYKSRKKTIRTCMHVLCSSHVCQCVWVCICVYIKSHVIDSKYNTYKYINKYDFIM